jgi:hypothetical protein
MIGHKKVIAIKASSGNTSKKARMRWRRVAAANRAAGRHSRRAAHFRRVQ